MVRKRTSHVWHMPRGDIEVVFLCTAVVMKKNCSLPAPIPLTVAQQKKQDMWNDFLREILSRFRANEMGILCHTDDTITMIGLKLFQGVATKIDKID